MNSKSIESVVGIECRNDGGKNLSDGWRLGWGGGGVVFGFWGGGELGFGEVDRPRADDIIERIGVLSGDYYSPTFFVASRIRGGVLCQDPSLNDTNGSGVLVLQIVSCSFLVVCFPLVLSLVLFHNPKVTASLKKGRNIKHYLTGIRD